MASLNSKIESLLFISAKPMSVNQLSTLTGKKSDEIKEAGDALVESYKTSKQGIQIIKNGLKYQMVSSPENAKLVQKFIQDETTGDLSRPSLEALTVIAYRGPISKMDLDRIRGVNCALILRNLLLRGLIEAKVDKKTEETYYTCTLDFIRFLGINEISELPDFERLNRDDTIDRMLEAPEEGAELKEVTAADNVADEDKKEEASEEEREDGPEPIFVGGESSEEAGEEEKKDEEGVEEEDDDNEEEPEAVESGEEEVRAEEAPEEVEEPQAESKPEEVVAEETPETREDTINEEVQTEDKPEETEDRETVQEPVIEETTEEETPAAEEIVAESEQSVETTESEEASAEEAVVETPAREPRSEETVTPESGNEPAPAEEEPSPILKAPAEGTRKLRTEIEEPKEREVVQIEVEDADKGTQPDSDIPSLDDAIAEADMGPDAKMTEPSPEVVASVNEIQDLIEGGLDEKGGTEDLGGTADEDRENNN